VRDIVATKGDTIGFDVYATAGEDTPIDLTGGKAWFYVKREHRDGDLDAVISLNTVDDPTKITFVAPATNGQIQVSLAPDDTVNIVDRYLPYDVQIKEANGTVTTVEWGMLELRNNITQVAV
jgi:hypothetical protein